MVQEDATLRDGGPLVLLIPRSISTCIGRHRHSMLSPHEHRQWSREPYEGPVLQLAQSLPMIRKEMNDRRKVCYIFGSECVDE